MQEKGKGEERLLLQLLAVVVIVHIVACAQPDVDTKPRRRKG